MQGPGKIAGALPFESYASNRRWDTRLWFASVTNIWLPLEIRRLTAASLKSFEEATRSLW